MCVNMYVYWCLYNVCVYVCSSFIVSSRLKIYVCMYCMCLCVYVFMFIYIYKYALRSTAWQLTKFRAQETKNHE